MTDAVIGQRTGARSFSILGALTFCHLINDLSTSLLLAIYPLLKSGFDLSFGQIGLLTLVFQGTASLLQPAIGLFTDRRPQPYSLPFGMAAIALGLAVLAFAPNYRRLLVGSCCSASARRSFIRNPRGMARLASGGAHGFAQSLFQVGGNFGNSLAPLAAASLVLPYGQRSMAWFALLAIVGIVILTRVGHTFGRSSLARPSRDESSVRAAPPRCRREWCGAPWRC